MLLDLWPWLQKRIQFSKIDCERFYTVLFFDYWLRVQKCRQFPKICFQSKQTPRNSQVKDQGSGKILGNTSITAFCCQGFPSRHPDTITPRFLFKIIKKDLGWDSQNQILILVCWKRVRCCLPHNPETSACQKNKLIATSLPRACQGACQATGHQEPRP